MSVRPSTFRKPRWRPAFAAAALAFSFAAVPVPGAANQVDPADAATLRLKAFALTADQRLVRFPVAAPQAARVVGPVGGLNGRDTALVGIDFRVQDGKLYGVGNAGGIYTIDTDTAVATLVSQLTVALSGASFGVDFNPAANALRIVSDAGQNLSHSIDNNATTAQTALNFPGRAAFAVTGVAYVNNDLDPSTGTILFDIDATNNVLAIQSPPGAGTLVTVGALGVDADAAIGFDIYSTVEDGVTVRNNGFAVLTTAGRSALYRINLLTGAASLAGSFRLPVIDIALPLNQ